MKGVGNLRSAKESRIGKKNREGKEEGRNVVSVRERGKKSNEECTEWFSEEKKERRKASQEENWKISKSKKKIEGYEKRKGEEGKRKRNIAASFGN